MQTIGSNSAHVPIPIWVFDAVMPHLDRGVLLTYLYILRRTWGEGKVKASVTVDEIRSGRSHPSRKMIDRGTLLSGASARKGLVALNRTRIVSVRREAQEVDGKRVYTVTPHWYDKIDWEMMRKLLEVPRSGICSAPPAELEPKGKRGPGSELIDPAGEMKGFLSGIGIRGDEPQKKIEKDVFMDAGAQIKAMRGQTSLSVAANKAGIPIQDAVRMIDTILIATGKMAVATGDDVEADRAHGEAMTAVVSLIGMGFQKVADIELIIKAFKATDTYANRNAKTQSGLAKSGLSAAEQAMAGATPIYTKDLINQASRMAAARQSSAAVEHKSAIPNVPTMSSDDLMVGMMD